MTYKNQMEKAIKGYLLPIGFKYRAMKYSYVRKVSEDLTQMVRCSEETHYRKQYFYLRTSATVSSIFLNEILYQVTDGLMDYRDECESPAYLNTLDGKEIIHTEFIGERTMEENIADFDRMYKEDVLQVFDKFKTTKDVLLCALREKYFNPYNRPCTWYYVPLAYYFNGEFDKAFEFIDKRIEIAKGSEARILSRYNSLDDEDTKDRRVYEAIRKNLKHWIANRRQFKVEDEYLPIFKEQATPLSEGWQKVQSFVGKILDKK